MIETLRNVRDNNFRRIKYRRFPRSIVILYHAGIHSRQTIQPCYMYIEIDKLEWTVYLLNI